MTIRFHTITPSIFAFAVAPWLALGGCTGDDGAGDGLSATTGTPPTGTGTPGGSDVGQTAASTGAGGGSQDSGGVDDDTSGSGGGATSAGEGSSGANGGSTGPGTGGIVEMEVDLANYEAVTDVVSIPSPMNDASGGAWNFDTNRVWIVQNGSSRFFEYADDDFTQPIRRVRLVGINGNDTEGLVYMGNGEVAVAFESGYGVYIADVPDGDVDIEIGVKQTLTLAPPPGVSNNGLEGIAYDVDNEVFYAVGEGQSNAAPRRFFRFERPAQTEVDLTWMDAGLVVTEPFDADAALPGSGASLDLAGIAFDRRDGNVLIISDRGTMVFQVDPMGDGTILSQLDLPPNQWEGVTLVGNNSDLLVVGETNEIQRYQYNAPD